MKKSIKLYAGKMLLAAIAIASLMVSGVMAAEDGAKTINVSGSGSFKAAPDIAYLNVGVTITQKTAEQATQESNRIMNSMSDNLVAAGVAKKDIQTSDFYVYPQYNYEATGKESITGYSVRNTYTVTVRNLAKVGEIIDLCITSGANTLNSASFHIEDSSKYYAEMYKSAVADARAKAAAIADAMGVQLGEIVSVGESGYSGYTPSYKEMAYDTGSGALAANSTSVQPPSEIELNSTVNLVFTYR